MTFGKNSAIHSFEGPEVPVYSRIAILSTIPIFSSQIGAKVLYILSQLQLLGIIFCSTVIDVKREGYATAGIKNIFAKIPVFYDFEESQKSLQIVFCITVYFWSIRSTEYNFTGILFQEIESEKNLASFLDENMVYCSDLSELHLLFYDSYSQSQTPFKSSPRKDCRSERNETQKYLYCSVYSNFGDKLCFFINYWDLVFNQSENQIHILNED